MGLGCHLKKDTTPTRNTGVKVKHHQKKWYWPNFHPESYWKFTECQNASGQWPLESTNQHWPGLVCQLVYGFVAVGCRLAPVGFLKLGRCVEDPQGFFQFHPLKGQDLTEEDWGRNTETHTLLLPKMSPQKELFQLGIHRLQPLIFRGKIRSFSGVNNFKPWPIGPFSMARQAYVFAGCCCRSNGLVHPTFFLARPWKQLAPWNLIALKSCLNHSYFFLGGNFKEVFAWWTKSRKPVDMVTWLRPKYVT